MRANTSPLSVLLLVCAASAIAGCSDPKAPSEVAFRPVLEPIVRDAFCRTIDLQPMVKEGGDENAVFPLTIPKTRSRFAPGYDGKAVTMMDEAARAGLLTRTEAEVVAKPRGAFGSYARQAVIVYAPTEKGTPFFRPVERRTGNGMLPFPAVCAAAGELVNVVRWSAPADFGGRRVSQVTYSYRGTNPLPLVPEADRARMAEPREATVPLVLESDGWRPAPR